MRCSSDQHLAVFFVQWSPFPQKWKLIWDETPADTPGYALTYADDCKLAEHDADCQEAGVNVLPQLFEVFGGCSENSRRTIKRIACLGDGRNAFSESSSVAINRLSQSISI